MALIANCTPAEVVNRYPCLHCLSTSDLLALLAYLWMAANSKQGDLATVLEDATCFDCISEKQKLEGEIAIMIDALLNNENITPASVMEIVRCMACLPKSKKESIILSMQCEYWAGRLA